MEPFVVGILLGTEALHNYEIQCIDFGFHAMHLSKQREGPNTHMPEGRNKHTWRKCTQICTATYVKQFNSTALNVYLDLYLYDTILCKYIHNIYIYIYVYNHPSVASRMYGSCRRTCSGVASRMCVSGNERYCPTPPHPSVASRMCGSCRRTCRRMCVSGNERYCPTPPHPSVASRMCGSCRRTGSGVASRMCVSANERYCPTPPHPSVASRMCGSCRRTCSGVASRMCGSCRRTCSGVASRIVSANERYCPTPPHPSVASRMCGSCRRTCSGVASRMCGSFRRTCSGVASRMCVSGNERYCPTPPHQNLCVLLDGKKSVSIK